MGKSGALRGDDDADESDGGGAAEAKDGMVEELDELGQPCWRRRVLRRRECQVV